MISADDRLAIVDAVHRWSHAVDGGDWELFATAATDDVALIVAARDGGTSRHVGLDAIRRFLGSTATTQYRRHVRNTIFDPTTDGLVRSYYLLTAVGDGGLARAIATGVYEDELVHTPSGWRIRQRTVRPDGASTEREPDSHPIV